MAAARSSGRGSKRRRISRSAEFERVYRQGRSHANRWLVVYAFPRAATDEAPRLGLSVSRKVGGAVERNRVKRLVREAFWAEVARLASDADYVVVARPEARLLGEQEGLTGVRHALVELLERHRSPTNRGRRAPSAEDGVPPASSPVVQGESAITAPAASPLTAEESSQGAATARAPGSSGAQSLFGEAQRPIGRDDA